MVALWWVLLKLTIFQPLRVSIFALSLSHLNVGPSWYGLRGVILCRWLNYLLKLLAKVFKLIAIFGSAIDLL